MKTNTNENFSRLSSQSGISLMETVIALFVFSLLVLTFAGTMSVSLRAGKMNGQYSQATSLCQHKIDQLRAVGYGRLTYSELKDAEIIDEDTTSSPYSFNQIDGTDEYLPQSQTFIYVEDVSSSVRKVTVEISWKNVPYGQRRNSMSVYGLIANITE